MKSSKRNVGPLLRVLLLLAVGLFISAISLGVLLFVVGVPLPWQQPPPPEALPQVSFTWVPPDQLPNTRSILMEEDLQDFMDVVLAARANGNGSLDMTEDRFNQLEGLIAAKCRVSAASSICFPVLFDRGQYFIMSLA